jgi:hypothetical protein
MEGKRMKYSYFIEVECTSFELKYFTFGEIYKLWYEGADVVLLDDNKDLHKLNWETVYANFLPLKELEVQKI